MCIFLCIFTHVLFYIGLLLFFKINIFISLCWFFYFSWWWIFQEVIFQINLLLLQSIKYYIYNNLLWENLWAWFVGFIHNTYMSQPWVKTYDEGKGLQRFGPIMKLRSHISCSRECRRVWGNEPTHSQRSSHFGSWNSHGLPNFQKSLGARVKTHWINNLFIPSKRSWNFYVWIGLAWPIWVFKT